MQPFLRLYCVYSMCARARLAALGRILPHRGIAAYTKLGLSFREDRTATSTRYAVSFDSRQLWKDSLSRSVSPLETLSSA